jgi:hypothetical protein
MSGVNIQLVAYGNQDHYLTSNPQISFFKKAYRRHTNYALEPKSISIDENRRANESGFGLSYSTRIPHKGDLLHKLYLEIEVEGKNTGTPSYTIGNFINSIIKTSEIKIGGFVIDKHMAQFTQIKTELNNETSQHFIQSSDTHGGIPTDINVYGDIGNYKIDTRERALGYSPLVYGGTVNDTDYAVGNTTDETTGLVTKRLIYNFDFWFCRDIGNSIPMSALNNHDIELNFEIESFNNLIGDNINIQSSSFKLGKLKLFGEYIILDGEEKRRFAQSAHEYLIEQVQYQGIEQTNDTAASDDIDETLLNTSNYILNFNHPIKYITWAVVNEGTALSNKGQGPCYFVSQTTNSLYSNDAHKGTIKFQLNGRDRIDDMPISFYTRQQPMRFTKSPSVLDRVGLYSFALNPFELEPSGTCNMSRIHRKEMVCNFANNKVSNIKNKKLYIFAVNYNILRITSGMAGLLFSA